MNLHTDKDKKTLLEIQDLRKYYPVKSKSLFPKVIGHIKAIDGVSFSIQEGETFGLVGESGCGKTTIGKTILCLEQATSGKVLFEGVDLVPLSENRRRALRKEMQIIFQDPYSSLDAQMTVQDIVSEPMLIHKLYPKHEIRKKALELLDIVGIASFQSRRLPKELSGGQRQRVGIARALALNPKFVVCDEPVSALDVSIQSQVLNLLSDLQKELGLSYLFIAHGMAVVKHISNRIGVMYLGKLVEVSNKSHLYINPLHPYTEALLSAIPMPNPELIRKRIILEGDVPSPINLPPGCRFHTRCPYASAFGDRCKNEEPKLVECQPEHLVACHKYTS